MLLTEGDRGRCRSRQRARASWVDGDAFIVRRGTDPADRSGYGVGDPDIDHGFELLRGLRTVGGAALSGCRALFAACGKVLDQLETAP